MSTIGSNFTFGAAGTEDTLYGFSYANIKTAAGESSDTDAFLLNSVVAGNLYYNAGSTAAPKYFKITDFTSSGGGVQIRLAGVFINNVKVNGTDAKVYWMPEGSGGTQNGDGSVATFGAPINANGNTAAFTVQAVDNVDGIFGPGLNGSGVGNDTVSTGTPATASINLTAVNDAPVIAGGATAAFNANENQTAVTTISASDVDGHTLTYTLSGSDASKFQINASGVLTFVSPPNFEAPTDVGADNVYNLIVTADDGQNQANSSTSQTIAVTVGNINDAPVNTVPLAQVADSARHVTFGGTLAVSDQDVADTLTATVSVLHGTFTSIGISGAAIGALGSSTLTISGTAAEVTAALNGLQYTGNVGFGSDTLTVTTTDGHGGVDIDTVNITPGIASVVSVGVPADGAYSAASSLDFTVNFDQAVTVTGNPRLELNVGGSVVFATYVSGSDSTQLVFNYVVQPGQNDGNGIDVVNLSLNGGTISNAAEVNASLVLNGLASTENVIIDTAAPAAGMLSFVNLDDTGASQTDHITQDGTFDLSLNDQEPGATIAYQVSTNGGTNWSTTGAAQSALADGNYSFRATVTDAAGNTSTTGAISVVIDNTAPINSLLYLSNFDDTGASNGDGITQNGTFNLSVSTCGSSDGVITYEKSLNGGAWTTTTSAQSALADGAYSFRAVATDAAGNFSHSNAVSVTVDNTAPAAGALSFANLLDTGASQADHITQDRAFDLSLNDQEAGTTVVHQVSINGGDWSDTGAAQSALADGNYSFRATVTDAAGNFSTTGPISVVIDNTAPESNWLYLANFDDTGASTGDGVTTDGTFDLSVSTCGSSDGAITYEMSLNGGDWTTTNSAQSELADGAYSFRAAATDVAGNSSYSNVVSVTVDNTAPAAGALSFANLDDTGASPADHITQDGTFDLSLSGQEPGATVVHQVSINGGDWIDTGAAQLDLADGNYSFRATVTDAAGNASTTEDISVVIDNTAPESSWLYLANFDDTGASTGDGVTTDGTFDLSVSTCGSSDGAITYEMSLNGGDWTTTNSAQSELADGAYSFRAAATDVAGNSSYSNVVSVTVDNTAPAAGMLSFANLDDTGASPADGITQDGTFDLSLSGQEPGTTVVHQVSINGGDWSDTGAAQSDLADGNYSFRATVTDAAGNASTTEDISVVIDNTAPAAAALTLASDSGFSAADAITNSGVINVAGLEANATWQYAVDEGNWQTGSGSSLTVAADGVHNVLVRQTDQAGNVSESSSLGFTLDTVAPQTKYLSAIYDASNGDVLTLTGTNVGDLLVTEGDFGADVFASLDFSKMGWDLNGDGTIDISLAGQVQSAFVTDNQTLQIVLDGDFAAALENNPAFGTAGGSAIDKLVIQNGFSTDLAGNVSSGDGATLQIMGALNEAGMPMVFGADFGGDQSTGYLHNETLGINVQPSYENGPYVQSVVFQKFDASVDTLHVTAPTSAASLDFVSFSQGVALAQPSNDYQHFGSGSGFAVVLEGANITGASGIRDSSVISFDDGSVLRTNSTAISATLSGGGEDDLLMAGSGGDRLLGNAGDDRLIGGSGNDHIYGGNGNDVIYGGGGSDYLVGGSGQDTFVFNDAEGVHATIADFSISDDQLLFDFDPQHPVATASGSDTLLTFESGSTIRLLGVSADAFGGGSAPQANIDHGGVFFAGGQNIFSGFEYS